MTAGLHNTLHGATASVGDLEADALSFLRQRLALAPLGRSVPQVEMDLLLDGSITAQGLGSREAWRRLSEIVVANTIGIDSERFLAFIPVSPAVAAVWADVIVGATSMPAESSLEAAGAVAAENQVLRFLAGLAGMPAGAGGCFMSGGSIGNLSALAVAREQQPLRRRVAVADTAHASIYNTLHLLGLSAVVVATDSSGRFTGDGLRAALDDVDNVAGADDHGIVDDIGIVVAAAGSTNAGVIDDLDGLADVAAALGAWFHVDAAYGGAALLLPECAQQLRGIGRADSFIVDPHKWLFSPAGSCALMYRQPSLAAQVHTQHGPYIDMFRAHGDEWNPSDFGFQLTRRASGVPLWFTLVLHGSDALAATIRRGLQLAQYAARQLGAAGEHVSLVHAPELSVVLFRRKGWGSREWAAWAARLLEAGVAFVAPTTWRGEAVGRLVFMHPLTPLSLIDEIVASLS